MNSDYERQLEAEISRELKQLPDLAAPASLVSRVLTTLERRAPVRWYCRSWQMWPAGLRWASLLVLAALFGGLCFTGWELAHTQTVTFALRRAENGFAAFSAIGNTLNVLLGSAFLVVKHLGTGFMIACLAALGLGYAVCVGLGTVYMRIALAVSAPEYSRSERVNPAGWTEASR